MCDIGFYNWFSHSLGTTSTAARVCWINLFHL